MHLTPPSDKARDSLEVFDRLIERAFAPREMTILSPVAAHPELLDSPGIERPQTPPPPGTPPDMPDEDLGEPSPAQQSSLRTVWEEVLSTKSKELEASPSKVKSLQGATVPAVPLPTPAQAAAKRKVPKRRSSVSFKESPDGRNLIVTFDMTGVKKQDMHVSYRTTRLIVSWRVERSMERREGNTMVREREVRKYSHTIPLPEGTKFEEVRASRDGQRLILAVPNSKCVRADVVDGMEVVNEEEEEEEEVVETDEADAEMPTNLRTIPDFETALSGVSEYHSCTLSRVA